MTDNCPACGALCGYSSEDQNRTISCHRCGATLSVRNDGLHWLAGGPSNGPAAAAAGAKLPFVARLSSWLFLAGLLLVLLFLFLPIIERAHVQAMEARVLDGEMAVKKIRRDLDARYREREEQLEEREARLKDTRQDLDERQNEITRRRNRVDRDRFDKDKGKNGDAQQLFDDEERLRKDEQTYREDREKFDEERNRSRSSLKKEYRFEEQKYRKAQQDWERKREVIEQEDKAALEATMLARGYWYSWGMLAGLMLLTGASLGFLMPQQPLIRRILGAIILAAVVLFVINKYAGGRGLLSMVVGGAGGGPVQTAGLRNYDFSTPRKALDSEMKMVINRDINALIDVSLEPQVAKFEEKARTLHVQKEATWGQTKLLFCLFREEGRERREVNGYSLDSRSGRWHRVPYVDTFSMERDNPALAREVRKWRGDEKFDKN
jgi:hypothetical protein